MDGIGLELWNKKLTLCRYKRQREFKECLDSSRIKGQFYSPTLLADLFSIAANNLDLLVLHWKEAFQGFWQRQKPTAPTAAAETAQTDILAFLVTEQKQLENEILTLGKESGLSWKPEDLPDGKGLLERQIAASKAGCKALIADLKALREDELERDTLQHDLRSREIWLTRILIGTLVLASTLLGAWFGARTHSMYSRADRDYIDAKLAVQGEGQRRIQEALNELRRSNRKIAFWTEKTPQQIDNDMDEAREKLKRQLQDIQAETARKIARVESEYARSGRDGGSELEMRRQGLLKLQAKLTEQAEAQTQKHLDELAEQKQNVMR